MENMKKKFDTRNNEKQELHINWLSEFYVNSREIWFVKMWVNIWFEENGKKEFRRPVLVLKKVWNMFFTVAMTTKGKENNRFYHRVENSTLLAKNEVQKSFCILSQVRTIDKKRFMHKIWEVESNEFDQIKKKLRSLLT